MNKLEQKEIELIQSYLTQEEAKTIIPQYKENFNSDFRKHNAFKFNPFDCLNFAFHWDKTPQGYDYWYRVYVLLKERYYDGI